MKILKTGGERHKVNSGGGSSSGPSSSSRPLSREVDALLTNELSAMSLKERENILHEIHGVDDIVQENAEMVQTKLRELKKRLDRYYQQQLQGSGDTSANAHAPLYHALQHSPNYVKDVNFLKMFLRSVKWDVDRAMNKLQLFFVEKQRLFGQESLGRDITLEQDFSEDDMRALSTGYSQLLPGRDNAGRAIWLSISNKREEIANLKCIVSTLTKGSRSLPLKSTLSHSLRLSPLAFFIFTVKGVVLRIDVSNRRCRNTNQRCVHCQI